MTYGIPDTPVGVLQHDELLSQMEAIAELAPWFVPAFDSLAKANGLTRYWNQVKPQPQPYATVLNVEKPKQLTG